MADDQYKARMQRKKAHIDNRIEEANIDKGIIVLLTGNGKGKSYFIPRYGLSCVGLRYESRYCKS
jgi:ATP:corrinoid adenosyltransferase